MRVLKFIAGFSGAATAAALTLSPAARAQVVISEVYTVGGKTGAVYSRDYIELCNDSDRVVPLQGWTITNTNTAGGGANNFTLSLPSLVLHPGQFFLIGLNGDNTSIGSPLPSPDLSNDDHNINSSSFSLALKNEKGVPVDVIGAGSGNAGSGRLAAAPDGNVSFLARRLENGNQHFRNTHDNGSDFVTATFNGTPRTPGYSGPRNSSVTLSTIEALPAAVASSVAVPAATIFVAPAVPKPASPRESSAPLSWLSLDLQSGWRLDAPSGTTAPLSVVSVDKQPFTNALHVDVLKKVAQDYEIQLVAVTTAPIAKGDVCLFTCYLRGMPVSGKDTGALVQAMFERTSEPYDNSLREPRLIGEKWERVNLPFVAAADFPTGKAKLNFRLGYAPETVEIGEPSLVDYGKSKSLAELPRTPVTYVGREPGAPWRKAALERIEKFRKADLVVRVVDANGKLVKGAAVTVALTRNAFPIGTAISDDFLTGPKFDTPDAQRWRTEFLAHFTSATAGILTWRWWESPETRAMNFADLNWLDKNGIKDIHGSHLVWTEWGHLPPDVVAKYRSDATVDAAKAGRDLQAETLAHIDSKLKALKARITVWNGINEVAENREMADDAGGIPAMTEWFNLAHRIEPTVPFIVNDYDILTKWGVNTDHLDDYYRLIKSLQDNGAPVGGIGFQSHFGTLLTSPERVLEILDRFARLGVPLHITEFDTKLTGADSDVQADYTRDFLLAVYSHPAVASFTMWGFWDGDSWIDNAPLFNKDWTLKPSGREFLGLTEDSWKSRAAGTTTVKGTFTIHGTLGAYVITAATSDGRSASSTATLSRGGSVVTVRLNAPLGRKAHP